MKETNFILAPAIDFEEVLEKKGVRVTPIRITLLRTMYSLPNEFTRLDIEANLKENKIKFSVSTIVTTLVRFSRSRVVKKIPVKKKDGHEGRPFVVYSLNVKPNG